jgi:hypothetical protein
VELALSWTGGYPFDIQQLGKHACNLAAGSPVGMRDIEAAMPAAQAALDTSIYGSGSSVPPIRSGATCAMAELGAGPYKAGDVAAKLGTRTTAVSVTRQRLLDKGLIYAAEDYGYVDFTVPRFPSSWCGTCRSA